eukprot:1194480-Prorocentrum_minimum.AAC.8
MLAGEHERRPRAPAEGLGAADPLLQGPQPAQAGQVRDHPAHLLPAAARHLPRVLQRGAGVHPAGAEPRADCGIHEPKHHRREALPHHALHGHCARRHLHLPGARPAAGAPARPLYRPLTPILSTDPSYRPHRRYLHLPGARQAAGAPARP